MAAGKKKWQGCHLVTKVEQFTDRYNCLVFLYSDNSCKNDFTNVTGTKRCKAIIWSLCTYQCKPRKGGGGGVRARGGDLTAKSISSVGGLIEYLCSGVGTFNFFRQRDWDQVKRG